MFLWSGTKCHQIEQLKIRYNMSHLVFKGCYLAVVRLRISFQVWCWTREAELSEGITNRSLVIFSLVLNWCEWSRNGSVKVLCNWDSIVVSCPASAFSNICCSAAFWAWPRSSTQAHLHCHYTRQVLYSLYITKILDKVRWMMLKTI